MTKQKKILTYLRRKLASDETFISSLNVRNNIFICSFPRSGNTALRLALTEACSNEIIEVKKIDNATIDLYQSPIDLITKLETSSQNIIKWHGYPYPVHERNNCIYVYREPVSVCRSYYSYLKYRHGKTDLTADGFVDQFLNEGDRYFGSWSMHLKLWHCFSQNSNSIFCSFKQLTEEPWKVAEDIKIKFCITDLDVGRFVASINKKRSAINANGVDFFGETKGHNEIDASIDKRRQQFDKLKDEYKKYE